MCAVKSIRTHLVSYPSIPSQSGSDLLHISEEKTRTWFFNDHAHDFFTGTRSLSQKRTDRITLGLPLTLT